MCAVASALGGAEPTEREGGVPWRAGTVTPGVYSVNMLLTRKGFFRLFGQPLSRIQYNLEVV
jgi:hypothetical protein